jgi:spermidine synthase
MTAAVIFSGASGLIFQIVWLYECGLAFGSSLWSATIVLSSFMCGLALGNALVTLRHRSISRPLRAYAALEVVVAASGVLLTYILPHSASIIGSLSLAPRFLAAFALLVVPTTAMGATLPVVVGERARLTQSFGSALGHLYGWNTFGGVVGVVTAEVVLVRLLGVKGTAWSAAALDILAAAIAFRLSRVRLAAPSRGRAHPLPAVGRAWRTLAAAALSGAILLSLEVVWFRFLTMFVLSTTLTVSVMLAVVLAAISAGGVVAAVWLRTVEGASGYASIAALVAGVVTVLTYAGFSVTTSGTQIALWTRVLWLACALALPTSFVSGMLFTLLGDALRASLPRATHTYAAASLTLANTIGATLGPPIATFLLLPQMGMEGAFFALALSYLAVAVLAWQPLSRRRGVTGLAIAAAAAAIFAVAIAAFPFGAMGSRYFARAASAYAGDGSTIVATREGAADTVFVMRQTWLGERVSDRLVTNGFSMSGTAVPAMRYMRAFAYWPMLLHHGTMSRALVVCYGVGVTVQAVEDVRSLSTIDVVEISPDVIAMSDVIYQGKPAPLSDPRVRLHVEDGRNFLQASKDERYDLITGEPPPPRTPGSVNIYTREYFRLLYDHLADDGVATYWLPVARPEPGTDIDTVARAFCDVFTDCTLWNATPFDLMLVGSRGAPKAIAEDTFRAPWVTPGIEARLREIGFEQPEQIGAAFLGDATYVGEITKNTPPLVDDFPQRLVPSARPSLSDPRYAADSAVAAYFQQVIDPARAKARFAASPWAQQVWPPGLRDKTAAAFDVQRIINRVIWDGGKPLRQIDDLHFVLTHTTLRALPLWILGSDEVKQRIAESSADRSGAVEYARALRAFTGHAYAAAASYLSEAQRRGFGGEQVVALRAYALGMAGQIDQARTLADAPHPNDPDEQYFWQWIKTRIASGGFAS